MLAGRKREREESSATHVQAGSGEGEVALEGDEQDDDGQTVASEPAEDEVAAERDPPDVRPRWRLRLLAQWFVGSDTPHALLGTGIVPPLPVGGEDAEEPSASGSAQRDDEAPAGAAASAAAVAGTATATAAPAAAATTSSDTELFDDDGGEVWQLGDEQLRVPLELLDSEVFRRVVSLSTWNEVLTAGQRETLLALLPEAARTDAHVRGLFERRNMHFGAPLDEVHRAFRLGHFHPVLGPLHRRAAVLARLEHRLQSDQVRHDAARSAEHFASQLREAHSRIYGQFLSSRPGGAGASGDGP